MVISVKPADIVLTVSPGDLAHFTELDNGRAALENATALFRKRDAEDTVLLEG